MSSDDQESRLLPRRDSDLETDHPGSQASSDTCVSNELEHDDVLDSYLEKPFTDVEPAGPDLQRPMIKERRYNTLHMVMAAVLPFLVAAVCTIAVLRGRDVVTKRDPDSSARPKPKFPIVASVFYGRRQNVQILDCYLRKNLISQGGYLDEVQFIQMTEIKEDMKYLDELVAKEPLYRKVNTTHEGWDWSKAWNAMADPDTMYIKIDDDVLFIADDAIPQLVHTLLDRPDAVAIAANAINEADDFYAAFHNGAILPFLPEPVGAKTRAINQDLTSWRISELPVYPSDVKVADTYNLSDGPPGEAKHRWLPLPNTYANLHKTPASKFIYCTKPSCDNGFTDWALGAQQHYSFFSHLEDPHKEAMSLYHFGGEHGVYDTQAERYSIHFVAIWGKTVIEAKMPEGANDEPRLTIDAPRELGRPFLVQTRSLVSHFSFGRQLKGMEKTDVRERYRAYANEMVCKEERRIAVE